MSDLHGTIFWTELATHDVMAAKACYAALFGWTYDATPMPDGGTYYTAMKNGNMVCGLFDMGTDPDMADMPSHWETYVAVDDVDATLVEAAKQGAKILRPAMDIPHVGRIAFIADPSGAMLGLMTPAG